jgi:hypothetical protein
MTYYVFWRRESMETNHAEIAPIVIDLNAAKDGKLDEFFPIAMMGAGIKELLKAMFGGSALPVSVKGSRDDIKAFARTLGKEKKYIGAYRKYGLNDPRTFKNKFKLNKSIKDFKKKTGLKWPFK